VNAYTRLHIFFLLMLQKGKGHKQHQSGFAEENREWTIVSFAE
jgi:hypothetical protein